MLVVAGIVEDPRIGGPPARRRASREPPRERLGMTTFELVEVPLPERDLAKQLVPVIDASEAVEEIRAVVPGSEHLVVAE